MRRQDGQKAPHLCTVYFIQAATLKVIKIGKASCVLTRFRNLRVVSPDTLMLLGEVAGEDGHQLERDLHARFAADRLHGEWFKPSDELLAYIAEKARTPTSQKDWRETRPGRVVAPPAERRPAEKPKARPVSPRVVMDPVRARYIRRAVR